MRNAHSRRDFLRDAAKFSAAAAAISETRAAAQSNARRPQRVAVIGAGHYHATLAPFYLRILQNEKLDIVGVHDPDRAVAEDRAKRCGSTRFTERLGLHADVLPVQLVDRDRAKNGSLGRARRRPLPPVRGWLG